MLGNPIVGCLSSPSRPISPSEVIRSSTRRPRSGRHTGSGRPSDDTFGDVAYASRRERQGAHRISPSFFFQFRSPKGAVCGNTIIATGSLLFAQPDQYPTSCQQALRETSRSWHISLYIRALAMVPGPLHLLISVSAIRSCVANGRRRISPARETLSLQKPTSS